MNRMFCLALLLLSSRVMALDWRDSLAVSAEFERAALQGTFVLYEIGSGQLLGHNRPRAETRYIPASTFKIGNSLIGLATGAVSSVDEVFPYDGKPRFLKTWERDMGLREAILIAVSTLIITCPCALALAALAKGLISTEQKVA